MSILEKFNLNGIRCLEAGTVLQRLIRGAYVNINLFVLLQWLYLKFQINPITTQNLPLL